MNEQLQAELVRFLRSSLEIAGQEIPATLQELVKWGMISGLIWGVAWLIFCVRAGFFAYQMLTSDDDEVRAVGGGFGSVAAILLFLAAISNFASAFQAWVAPRAYLFDLLAELAK